MSCCREFTTNVTYASNSKHNVTRHKPTFTKIRKVLITKCASNFVVNNDVLIAEFLLFSTVERIKQFESLLKTTEEAVTQFVRILCIFIL